MAYVFKILVLGENHVGKTAILSKYSNSQFSDTENNTDSPLYYYEKTVEYKGKKIKLEFWDIGVKEKFQATLTMFYKNAKGALIIYDVTNFETFEKVETLFYLLEEEFGKDIPILIIGNKFDLSYNKSFKEHTEEIKDFCDKEYCDHFYTSAKNGYNLEKAFERLINNVVPKEFPEEEMKIRIGRGKRIEICEDKYDNKGGSC